MTANKGFTPLVDRSTKLRDVLRYDPQTGKWVKTGRKRIPEALFGEKHLTAEGRRLFDALCAFLGRKPDMKRMHMRSVSFVYALDPAEDTTRYLVAGDYIADRGWSPMCPVIVTPGRRFKNRPVTYVRYKFAG